MLRSLLLLLFTALPLVAGAHEGHRAHAKPESAPAERAQPPASRPAITAVAAPSRCPGGGHEACCCHDLAVTPSFQPIAVIDGAQSEPFIWISSASIASRTPPALHASALLHLPARGPPLHS